MKSIVTFFNKLTLGKKILLVFTPVVSALVSMKLAMFGLWLLIFIDLLTGIRKNLYKNGVGCNIFKAEFWKSIKSYLLRQTWRKTYEYGVGIILFVIFESLILGATPITLINKTFTISELSVLIPAAVEIWSIYENLEEVSGHNILDKIKALLPQQLRDLFSSSKSKNENNV